jgi:D-glycero-D-manno-heptose 1,7-bisphosphate phosphatase
MPGKALFLDRDGTLIHDRNYLADPAQVELLPGVRETLHAFAAEGWRLFLFTNQSGIGHGLFTLETVERCNARLDELLALPAPGFTGTCIAPETPQMTQVYRKPSPRFILEMIARHNLDPRATWMAGDKASDVQAGLNAGVRAVLVGERPERNVPGAVWRCADLPAFYARLHSGGKSAT